MKLCIFGTAPRRGVGGCFPTDDEIYEEIRSWSAISTLTGIELVCGMAAGADECGYRWATGLSYAEAKRGVFPLNGTKVIEMPADWDRYGNGAGPIRNEQMAKECDLALGWWDGKSSGTANMATLCLSLGKPVRIVRWRKT
jgi:hypothetical protein